MPKYKIILEYDGTGYRGWQTQKNARSIQGTLIAAAQEFFGGPVEVQGAGRTDAGVHALGQIAHLETAKPMVPRSIIEGLNDRLPSSINILQVEEAHPQFHARHHAKARSYLYVISRQRTAFGKRYVWWIKDRLDVRPMQAISRVFQGFHDFSSFADRRLDKEASTKVMIHGVEIREADDLIVIRISGSHFLWKMVRRMVGILVEAGRGSLSRRDVEGMLKEPSDLPAKHTAPPSGLFLEKVFYEQDLQGSTAWSPLPLPLVIIPPLKQG